jgi:hypothetical protein
VTSTDCLGCCAVLCYALLEPLTGIVPQKKPKGKTLHEIEEEEGGPVKESMVGMAAVKRAIRRKKAAAGGALGGGRGQGNSSSRWTRSRGDCLMQTCSLTTRMALPTRTGTDSQRPFVDHQREPHQQPRLLPSCTNRAASGGGAGERQPH